MRTDRWLAQTKPKKNMHCRVQIGRACCKGGLVLLFKLDQDLIPLSPVGQYNAYKKQLGMKKRKKRKMSISIRYRKNRYGKSKKYFKCKVILS